MMKINLKYTAALAVALIADHVATAEMIAFIGDSTLPGGWEAFETTSGYVMTPIISDERKFSLVESIPTRDGPFLLSPAHERRTVGLSWASWSHGGPVTGELFWTGGPGSSKYTMPNGTVAFDMYVEPEPFSIHCYTATVTGSSGSTTSQFFCADAPSGASHIGFYSVDDETIESVSVVDATGASYAIAEMRYAALEIECDSDLTGDGSVGPADLAELLGQWGQCPFCPADLTLDGVVGPADLAIVLGEWGSCE